MITGLTPRGHGCISNGVSLPENIPTVTGALADAGYRTHTVGKLHLQPFMAGRRSDDDGAVRSWEDRDQWDRGCIESLPSPYYGFQTSDYVGGHVGYCFGDYANWLDANHPGAKALYNKNEAYHVDKIESSWRMEVPAELHYNTWIADRSMDFVDSLQSDESFFLWCSFPDPHFPYAASRPYSEMYDPDALSLSPTWEMREQPCDHLEKYREDFSVMPDFDEASLREVTAQTYGMITHIDDNVGRVLRHLDGIGRADNTVVVLMSDHGEFLGAHHLVYKGAWPWEELYRVPFVWRGLERRGVPDSDNVASILDFVPTVLDYAGIDSAVLDARNTGDARRETLPGRSLRPAIDQGDRMAPKPAIVEFDQDLNYDRDWSSRAMYRMRTIVEERYKLTVYPHAGSGILIDLEDDPHEERNLWDDPLHAEVKARLTLALLEELAMGDRLDVPRISGA